MVNYKNFAIEYITALIFGVLGLLLSLFAGFISGNKIISVFVRSVIITIGFAFIGYICLIIVKKFVPEIYQVFSNINENKEVNLNNDRDNSKGSEIDSAENMPETSIAEADSGTETRVPDVELEDQFNTLEKEQAGESFLSKDKVDAGTASKSFSREKNITYEPKIAAQAIRTMMKRDE
ncbi:MAG: hypothetical protein JW864_13055 [Spirochaetes bacterium]|nr:hypothetical protein [Spirochaetota bacterium]